jgi:hypothetical protein
MDDSFQFIFESPQTSHSHKKRPRLVTSCDNCRLKKIKCIQSSPETRCEACKAAKISCKFRDRERYFAERSRVIAGGTTSYGDRTGRGSVEPSGMPAYATRTVHSARTSGTHSSAGSSRDSYSPDSSHSPQLHQRQSSSSSLPSIDSQTEAQVFGYQSPSPQAVHVQSRQSLSSLFDLHEPQYPSSILMPHLIQLFSEQFGTEFTFISGEELLRDHWDHTLPALLSNCIAAMAARVSALPELQARGLQNVVDAFADNAKAILNSVSHIPSLNNLHALILLAWVEYRSNRIAGSNFPYPDTTALPGF